MPWQVTAAGAEAALPARPIATRRVDIPARFPQNLPNEVLQFNSAAVTVTAGPAGVENASDCIIAQALILQARRHIACGPFSVRHFEYTLKKLATRAR